jgi:hypothetical protein
LAVVPTLPIAVSARVVVLIEYNLPHITASSLLLLYVIPCTAQVIVLYIALVICHLLLVIHQSLILAFLDIDKYSDGKLFLLIELESIFLPRLFIFISCAI